MVKTHTTLTIDGDIMEKAKALQINISGEFQKFLEKMVQTYEGDIEGINLELLNIDIMRLKNQKIKIDIDLQSKLRTKEILDEVAKKKEQENLIKEKENLEKQSQCQQCKRVLVEKEKKHKFAIGFICNSCYMSGDGSAITRWNNL